MSDTLFHKHETLKAAEAWNVFWRAIGTNKSAKITIQGDDSYTIQLPPGPILLQFLRERPSPQVLDFCEFSFMEEHCRALATLERTDLEITLNHCALVPQNAQAVLSSGFGTTKS